MGENSQGLEDALSSRGDVGLGTSVRVSTPAAPTPTRKANLSVKGNFYRVSMSWSRALAGSFLPYSRGMHCLGVG